MATGIYKRSNVWWIRYTGIDGRQKRESSYKKRVIFRITLMVKTGKSLILLVGDAGIEPATSSV